MPPLILVNKSFISNKATVSVQDEALQEKIDLIVTYYIKFFLRLMSFYNCQMGANFSDENPKSLQKSLSATDQYLSNYQLQRLTPRLVKSLSFRRPYQSLLKQDKKKTKKLSIQQGLYQGDINENKKPFGLGKIYSENGSLIIGKFQDGIIVGQHHAFQANGSYFFGTSTEKNQKKGTVYYSDGTLQQGYFLNGLLEGLGSEKTLKYTFDGQFHKGRPVKGNLRWQKHNQAYSYEGSFDENGNFTGEGKLIEPMGTYTGSFKSGLKDGKGKYEFTNGLQYQGQYSKGIKQGHGILYNPDHTPCYEGHFSNNLPNGKGACLNTKGKKIESEYHQGLSKRQLALIQTMSSIDNGENLEK